MNAPAEPKRPGLFPLAMTLAGALVAMGAWPTVIIGLRVLYQIGWVRAAALAGLVAGLVAALALVSAWGLRTLGLTARPRLTDAARTGFYAIAVASLALSGLTIFFLSPFKAPLVWKLGAGAATLALLAAFWRQGQAERTFSAGALVRLGQMATAAPLLATPWIVQGALTPHRIPESPLPPAGARLEAEAPRRIVLVTFDGLRYRSTSLADARSDRTPALAALARVSTSFDACRAAGERTQVSLGTLLTGVPPQAIFPRTESSAGYLRGGMVTGLAGHLAPAGYRSYYATMFLDPQVFGMADEFAGGLLDARHLHPNQLNSAEYVPWRRFPGWLGEQLFGHEPVGEGADNLRVTRRTFERAARYLGNADGRTFVWVHVGVPHLPYYRVPAGDLGRELHPERYEKVTTEEVNARRLIPGAMEHYEAVYEDFVRFADAELGRFLATLRQDPAWDETMLVVSSDHGEEFSPIQVAHGKGFINEDVAHVPLIVHLPGQRTPARVGVPVGHADVVPTVLDAVYRDVPAGFAGASLLAPLDADRVVYSWGRFERYAAPEGHPHTVAAYQGRYKYRLMTFPRREEYLYDLVADPREARNLVERLPEVTRALRARVEREGGVE